MTGPPGGPVQRLGHAPRPGCPRPGSTRAAGRNFLLARGPFPGRGNSSQEGARHDARHRPTRHRRRPPGAPRHAAAAGRSLGRRPRRRPAGLGRSVAAGVQPADDGDRGCPVGPARRAPRARADRACRRAGRRRARGRPGPGGRPRRRPAHHPHPGCLHPFAGAAADDPAAHRRAAGRRLGRRTARRAAGLEPPDAAADVPADRRRGAPPRPRRRRPGAGAGTTQHADRAAAVAAECARAGGP
jgi:hypothetical protein